MDIRQRQDVDGEVAGNATPTTTSTYEIVGHSVGDTFIPLLATMQK